MAGLPDTMAAEVVDYITGRAVATTAPAASYLALLTADPGALATMATLGEDTTAGYVRQSIVWNVPTGSPPVTSNTAQITFGPFTAAQALPVTHYALVTAATGTTGKIKWVQPLDVGFQAAAGDSLIFPPGSIDLGFLNADAA